MSSNKSQSKFSVWYNSPAGKRLVGAVYSLGASVVIIGALFKIMHWPLAGVLLTAGMITEAILFAIGVFEKPHKEYDWDKVFSFEGEGQSLSGFGGGAGSAQQTMPAVGQLDEKEVQSLSEGIKNLSATAKELSSLSVAMGAAKDFAKSMESAAELTSKYTETQQSLEKATGNLFASYETLNADMNAVVDHTKQYADNVVGLNKNLSSLNSLYEIQLKNLQIQSETVAAQTESTRLINKNLDELVAEQKKIHEETVKAGEEMGKYRNSAAQLTAQVAELNKVYGNMLNALS